MVPCQASGQPTPIVSWYTSKYRRSDVPVSRDTHSSVHYLENGTLVLFPVSSVHQDSYVCVADNLVAQNIQFLFIIVISGKALIISYTISSSVFFEQLLEAPSHQLQLL